jgi:hypothetical protein
VKRAALALLLAACDAGETAPAPPAERAEAPAPSEPVAAPEDEGPEELACRLEPPFARRAIEQPLAVIAVSRSEDGAGTPLVLAAVEGGHAALRVEGDALVPVEDAPLAGELIGLESLGAGEHLALALGPCGDGLTATCLHARRLGRSEGMELPQPAPLRTVRVAASDGLVHLARSYRGAPPTLDRFGLREGALHHDALRIGDGVLPDEPVEMLGLSADGAAYALVYRHGATEDVESGVVLATQLDEHHVELLHDALVIESMSWVGSSIAVLAAFEFARPAYLRLGADGEVRSAPRELPFGAPLPEPFAGRFIARVRGAPGALSLEVRSAAGDRIGAPIPLDGARAADLAREPGGFLVAWLDDGAVVVAHLRC